MFRSSQSRSSSQTDRSFDVNFLRASFGEKFVCYPNTARTCWIVVAGFSGDCRCPPVLRVRLIDALISRLFVARLTAFNSETTLWKQAVLRLLSDLQLDRLAAYRGLFDALPGKFDA